MTEHDYKIIRNFHTLRMINHCLAHLDTELYDDIDGIQIGLVKKAFDLLEKKIVREIDVEGRSNLTE